MPPTVAAGMATKLPSAAEGYCRALSHSIRSTTTPEIMGPFGKNNERERNQETPPRNSLA